MSTLIWDQTSAVCIKQWIMFSCLMMEALLCKDISHGHVTSVKQFDNNIYKLSTVSAVSSFPTLTRRGHPTQTTSLSNITPHFHISIIFPSLKMARVCLLLQIFYRLTSSTLAIILSCYICCTKGQSPKVA